MDFSREQLAALYMRTSTDVEFEGVAQKCYTQFTSGMDNRVPLIELSALDENISLKYEIYSKKYKPVGVKVKPVLTELPKEYQIVREIKGDALEGMPEVRIDPPPYEPGVRYGPEQYAIVQGKHEKFLLQEEMRIVHDIF